MNGKPCASTDKTQSWETIDWKQASAYVKKLQMRIVKAQKEGHFSKVKSLQWLLTHSFYAKALAVKRVTSNQGKNTSGVDHELWQTPQAKFKAISKLNRRGYHPQPLRRIYIPKKNGKMRPLGIPTMTDRAMQTLYKFALEPIAETYADPNSYGFRTGRSTHDAIEQCFTDLAKADVRFLPLTIYAVRWSIEVAYYEQKKFRSLEVYMLRSRSGIERLTNLLTILYAFMTVLPFYDKTFSALSHNNPQQ